MDEAKQLAEHMLSLPDDTRKRVSHSALTGVVLSYSRSFGQNDGMSSLPAKFSKFTNSTHERLHRILIDARNVMFAHKDALKEGARLPKDLAGVDLSEITIRIDERGRTTWLVKRPTLPLEYLPDIIKLCEFQIDRINKESADILTRACAGKAYEPGDYILGSTFP